MQGFRFPADGSADAVARAGGHSYDVHELLGHDETRRVLETESGLVERLAADVGEQSRLHGLRFTIRPPGGYAESPAFDQRHPCRQAAAAGYSRATTLIYGRVPSFSDCLRRVREAGSVL